MKFKRFEGMQYENLMCYQNVETVHLILIAITKITEIQKCPHPYMYILITTSHTY